MEMLKCISFVLWSILSMIFFLNVHTQAEISSSDPYVLENQGFRLEISVSSGLNPKLLHLKPENIDISAGDYFYGFGRPKNVTCEIIKTQQLSKAVFVGKTEKLQITQTYLFPSNDCWFEEEISVKNIADQKVDFSEVISDTRMLLRTGFTFAIEGNGSMGDWRAMAVPYLIDTVSGKRREYLLKDVAGADGNMGSEGWILTNGDTGMLIIKYAQQHIENSLIGDKPQKEKSETIAPEICFGGAGLWRSDPEAAMTILPNETIALGTTRYIAFSEGWQNGFRHFRKFMDAKGHKFKDGFNPPVHWNEIYDNPHWWNAPDTEEKRAEYYCLADMECEAAKAKEIGCEALYLDPGWDTHFGSTLWAADRLMSCRKFCEFMEQKYGLKVSLHTPLAQWNIYRTYPPTSLARNENGEYFRSCDWLGFDYVMCSSAPGWWDSKIERLLSLAGDGIAFFMFDGTNYVPCCDKSHGHSVPYTREAHIRSYAELARQIHKKYPQVLIEMHDQVLGPTPARYVPTYYTHSSETFDSIWAFEYMWDPMQDLLSGKALSLYYYNLAYNIPLYLHINLKTDNEQALAFWWYASTCRHLGIGGKEGVKASPPSVEVAYAHLGIGEKNSPPPKIWQIHKKAMAEYMQSKALYVRGEFYGIDELTHVHTDAETNSAVINCFNISDSGFLKSFTVRFKDIGLKAEGKYTVSGADSFQVIDSEIKISVLIPAKGVKLIYIRNDNGD